MDNQRSRVFRSQILIKDILKSEAKVLDLAGIMTLLGHADIFDIAECGHKSGSKATVYRSLLRDDCIHAKKEATFQIVRYS